MTEERTHRPLRIRLNVSTTSKGLPSYEATVDGQDSGASQDDVLAELTALVEKLRALYPTEVPL